MLIIISNDEDRGCSFLEQIATCIIYYCINNEKYYVMKVSLDSSLGRESNVLVPTLPLSARSSDECDCSG